MTFDCEILPTDETLRRGIAGFKAQIIDRREGKLIVRIWDDFKPGWTEAQFVDPGEVREIK